MWKKLTLGLKALTIFNIFSLLFLIWDYSRGGGVTYFLTTPVYVPFAWLVLAFDLFLAVGPIAAVWTSRKWWWQVGVANYGYAVVIDLIVIAKLFFGSKAGVMGLSEFWISIIIYGGQLAFFGLIMLYWLGLKKAFTKA